MAGSDIKDKIRRWADEVSSTKNAEISLTELVSFTEILIVAMQSYFRSIDETMYRECAATAKYIEGIRRDTRPISIAEMAEILARIERHLRVILDQGGIHRDDTHQSQGKPVTPIPGPEGDWGPDKSVDKPATKGGQARGRKGERGENGVWRAPSRDTDEAEFFDADAEAAQIDSNCPDKQISDGKSMFQAGPDKSDGKKKSKRPAGRPQLGNAKATEPPGRTTSQAVIDKLFG